MNLTQLFETRTENKDLIDLSKIILSKYKNNPQRELSLQGLYSADEPAIANLVQTVKVKIDSKFDRSLYNPKTKEVLLRLQTNLGQMQSELVHELQHALDDLKSQGKFRNEKGDYYGRQSEVNARLTQAINDIENALSKIKMKNPDFSNPVIRNNVEKLIHNYLRIHKLTDQYGLDNKRYRRLVSRIYQYVVNR